jgi:hypothetical protein
LDLCPRRRRSQTRVGQSAMDEYRQEVGAIIRARTGVPDPKNENPQVQLWKSSPLPAKYRQTAGMRRADD